MTNQIYSVDMAHNHQTFAETCQVFTRVMDRGQIVKRGAHEELLTSGGLYSQLYETQFRGERV